jgi:3-hydroxyisobutyrate dehydrogenase-like beta-hydroxyacid dehydrogenase
MKLGFIGLGKMGAGMARNLLLAGHEVIVYNRTRIKPRRCGPMAPGLLFQQPKPCKATMRF